MRHGTLRVTLTAAGQQLEQARPAIHAEKVAGVLRQKVPVQKHERRNLIMQWHQHVAQQLRA